MTDTIYTPARLAVAASLAADGPLTYGPGVERRAPCPTCGIEAGDCDLLTHLAYLPGRVDTSYQVAAVLGICAECHGANGLHIEGECSQWRDGADDYPPDPDGEDGTRARNADPRYWY